jgi:hypothetical protein
MMRSLRILVVTDWCLAAIAIPLAFLLEPSLPPQFREFLALEQERPFGVVELLQSAAMLLSIVLWVVGSVGLFLLQRWARPVYCAAVVTGVMFTPFVGPIVMAPLAAALEDASLIVSGLVLGIIYLSPGREELRPTRVTADIS